MEHGKFVWPVAERGYEWRDVTRTSDRMDGRGLVAVHGGQFRHTEPLANFGGLFRTFADTPATEDGVKAFADRYGFLGDPLSFNVDIGGGHETAAEALVNWSREIEAVRLAVETWELLRAGDPSAIYQHCIARFVGQDAPRLRWPRYGEAWAGVTGGRPSPANPSTLAHEPAAMGSACLTRLVGEALDGRVAPILEADGGPGNFRLRLMPLSLIGAIWLQLSAAIDGNREYRRCECCGTWFEVRPPVTRGSRKYCSAACRTRSYRQRSQEPGK